MCVQVGIRFTSVIVSFQCTFASVFSQLSPGGCFAPHPWSFGGKRICLVVHRLSKGVDSFHTGVPRAFYMLLQGSAPLIVQQ